MEVGCGGEGSMHRLPFVSYRDWSTHDARPASEANAWMRAETTYECRFVSGRRQARHGAKALPLAISASEASEPHAEDEISRL